HCKRRGCRSVAMSRVVRLLGRTKAYITECKQNMAPLPNPEWYEEGKDTRVTFKNLRKLPLSVHTEIWSSTWKWYRESFAESFAWSQKRKEEAKNREAHAKMNTLRGMVKEAREVTHNSPEDLEKSKEALKELMEEIHENRDELKSAAQEKLDLIRVSLSEFSTGYRQARDEEIKRVMAMDKSMLQSFLSERAGEVKHATSVIADAILEKDGGAGGSSSREEGGRSSPASRSAPAPPSNDNAAPDAPSVARPQEQPGTVSSTTAASDAESHPSNDPGHADLDGGATRFLSPRARRAVDDVLRDPDVERLAGRAKGFARERLLKAEEAARIIKGEEEESGER
ncbi:unnamed protein product, partial [Ectocarpus sp. 6 AP-2014]